MANGLKADLGPLRLPWDVGTLAGLDDRELLARFVEEKSALAFEGLVRRHGPMVLRVCSQLLDDRHAAEDAFQAVFVVLARRAGSIRGPEKLGPWLHGVALRTARESRSREMRRKKFERRGATMQPTTSGPPDRPMILAEDAAILHGEIAKLPERYRGPVVLCDLEGLTQQEAATLLRCPLGTVAIRLKRARERLRSRLARKGLDPTAGLIAANLGSSHLPTLSPTLIEAAVRASTTAGLASASVVSLARGVQMAMTIAKWKLMAVSATALVLGLAATWGVASGRQDPARADRPKNAPAAVPDGAIEPAVLKQVRDFNIYVGVAEPSREREIRARVDGQVAKVLVEHGAKVKADEVLFEIDPKPYQAELELAQARLTQAKNQRALALTVVARNKRLREKGPDLISKEEVEKAEQELAFATKLVADVELTEELAKTQLAATQVRAPFDGEVSLRAERPPGYAPNPRKAETPIAGVFPGNLIKGNQTLLARIAATDPMAVAFNVDERTILDLRRIFGDDRAKAAEVLEIRVGLITEGGFPRRATLESLPDRLDPETGTGRFRATIPNSDGLLRPGMSAQVRMAIGPPRETLLVPESAVRRVEQRVTVRVVGQGGAIEERTVKVGRSFDDRLEILEGLKPGERVLIKGPDSAKPGQPLKP